MLDRLRCLLSGLFWLSLAVLTGCLPQKPTADNIVGQWVEERQSSSNSGTTAGCAVFKFYANGQFEAHNIPQEYFSISLPPSRIDAVGEWELEINKDPLGWDALNLKFDLPGRASFGSKLNVASDGSERTLFAWRGDESIRVSFVKRELVQC